MKDEQPSRVTEVDIINQFGSDKDEDIIGFLIFRAMVKTLTHGEDIRQKFNLTLPNVRTVEVDVRVNGVPVDFAVALLTTWKMMNEDVDRRARQLAFQMIKDTGLSDLENVLRNARQQILDKLERYDNDN